MFAPLPSPTRGARARLNVRQMFAHPRYSTVAGSLLLVVAVACSSAGHTDGERTTEAVCSPVAPTECADPAPHYSDVSPIFEQRCASCHTGVAGGPWPLDTYEHVADWASFVRDELLRCSMPLSDSGVPMTPEERDQILLWLRCGNPK